MITDLNAFYLEINDLQLAIMQADDDRHFEHFIPDLIDLAIAKWTYWVDVYQKVL
ncbi:MAG: hypothetical protein JKY70_00560 [Mucilaginibacter sp.]|nr:hypothetical protein [Mucilaginibacter sp.]